MICLGPTHTAAGVQRFLHYQGPLDLDGYAPFSQGRYVTLLAPRSASILYFQAKLLMESSPCRCMLTAVSSLSRSTGPRLLRTFQSGSQFHSASPNPYYRIRNELSNLLQIGNIWVDNTTLYYNPFLV